MNITQAETEKGEPQLSLEILINSIRDFVRVSVCACENGTQCWKHAIEYHLNYYDNVKALDSRRAEAKQAEVVEVLQGFVSETWERPLVSKKILKWRNKFVDLLKEIRPLETVSEEKEK